MNERKKDDLLVTRINYQWNLKGKMSGISQMYFQAIPFVQILINVALWSSNDTTEVRILGSSLMLWR
jgi:hypothetical protein